LKLVAVEAEVHAETGELMVELGWCRPGILLLI